MIDRLKARRGYSGGMIKNAHVDRTLNVNRHYTLTMYDGVKSGSNCISFSMHALMVFHLHYSFIECTECIECIP